MNIDAEAEIEKIKADINYTNAQKEKTEAEKTAETIGKTLAGSNEVTKTVVDSYL